MANSNPPLRELHFGHLDASQEALEEPDLLRDGFFDYREAAYGIDAQSTWVLLGPKGSGKSAVLEHLRLRWDERPDRFLTVWPLGGFPVNDVTQIPMGQSRGGSRAQAAWEFVLMMRVIESLSADEGLNQPGTFTELVKALREGGYITGDWTAAVSRWASFKLSFDAKIVAGEGTRARQEITPLDITAYMRQELAKVSTKSKHVVALDGLDSFFFEAEDEWTSFTGLMQAIRALNLSFRSTNLPVTVVAAARSDVFDVLSGGEKNKLKPHATYLDWHAHGIGSKNNLWKLLTQKAAVTRPEVRDLVRQYFGTNVLIGPHREMAEYLLDNTRLLPRDAVALMGYVQRAYGGTKHLSEEAAKEAVLWYGEEYFVGEIFDNLAGVVPAGKSRAVSSFRDALRTSPSRYLNFSYLREELAGELEPPEIKNLLKQMFEVGGIGIRVNGHTNFVFRKVSGAGFSHRYEFVLHDALTRAWNLNWR